MTSQLDPLRRRLGEPWTRLRRGPWSLVVRGDEVADLRYGGLRLLRAVRPVVRDRDWNTVPVRVLGHRVAAGQDGLDAELRFDDGAVSYRGTLQVHLGDTDVTVGLLGRALTAFERNRIGLVVLHPATEAGHPVTVTHTDGTQETARWPVAISAHQPFRDVAGFAWTRDGVRARLELAGEVFETEDQRNWTDASYKTYGTPLARPFPVRVPAGDECRQQVRLSAGGPPPPARPVPPDVVTVGPDTLGRVPAVAVGAALDPAVPSRVALPGLDALLVELVGPEPGWPDRLSAAAAQAAALRTALDVRVVTAEEGAVARAVALLSGLPVRRLGVFDTAGHSTGAGLWSALQTSVRDRAPTPELVGGTRAHFTELNRQQHLLPRDLPALTFSLTPQMHATEVPHIVDSLATQRTVVDNARRLAAGRPLHIGPVTLARRFNAVATGLTPGPAADAQRAVDPLQPTAFAGAWVVGSLAALAVDGVASVCYFEAAGARGIQTDGGDLTPAGRVLAAAAGLRGRRTLHVRHPDDLAVLAVAVDEGVRVLLGNLADRPRELMLRGPGAERVVRVEPWSLTATTLG